MRTILFKADPALAEQLAAEMSDEEYESKISSLLARSFSADVAANSQAAHLWQQARTVLEEGDYYISIMVERAGRAARKLIHLKA
jgi:hypothetical protein